MAFVVDASVAVGWLFRDEQNAYAHGVLRRLASDSAVVPSLWMFEVANGLVTANRRGRMAAAHLTAAHGLLARLPIDVDDISLDRALGDVVRLASAYGLSAYDAAYLELAERLGLPLATQDTALQAAAVAAGTPLVEPAGPSN